MFLALLASSPTSYLIWQKPPCNQLPCSLSPAFSIKNTEASSREQRKSRGGNPPAGLQALGFMPDSDELLWKRKRRIRWNMNKSQRRGYHLAVHHIFAYFMTVKSSFSPTLLASHYYNTTIHLFHSISVHLSFAVVQVKSFFSAHASHAYVYSVKYDCSSFPFWLF